MLPPNQIPFEPFKIKMVEPIASASPLTADSLARRDAVLRAAHYNVFNIPADEVTIDLLTDSGTGAMSQAQWSALMSGDEAYAQAVSYRRFSEAVKSVIGSEFHIIPTHQGRAAENIIFRILNRMAAESRLGEEPLRRRVLVNSFFDTTAANVAMHGQLSDDEKGKVHNRIELENLKREILITPNQLVVDQRRPERFEHGIFGGNLDLDRLEAVLKDGARRREVMLVMVTATNNTGGGLPVSLGNMRAVREMIDHYSKADRPLAQGLPPLMFFMDACRFAENAWFIKRHEPGYSGRSVKEIAREMFSLMDGATMSAKKDGMANIGGFLAVRSETVRDRCYEYMVEVEGFPSYGGLAGRDLDAVAVGIMEGVDDERVAQRIRQVQTLWTWLKEEGVPVKEPCGGHGVFLKGREFWTVGDRRLIADEDLPGQTLTVELFRRYGIRACEIGTIMFGDYNSVTGKPDRVAPDEDYVRLAIPRRVYTDRHLEYVAAALAELYRQRGSSPWRGMRFTRRAPVLPHFLSHFEPIVK